MPTAIYLPEAPAESVAKVEAFDQACVCVLDDDLSMLKALDRLFKSDGVTIKTFSEPSAFLSAVAVTSRPIDHATRLRGTGLCAR